MRTFPENDRKLGGAVWHNLSFFSGRNSRLSSQRMFQIAEQLGFTCKSLACNIPTELWLLRVKKKEEEVEEER